MKKLMMAIKYIFTAGVYWLVFLEFFISIVFTPLFLTKYKINEYGNLKTVWAVYIVAILLAVFSLVYAFFSLRKQDRFYKIFGIKVSTILISLLGTGIITAIYLHLWGANSFFDSRDMKIVPFSVIVLFQYTPLFYPFFALVEYIVRNRFFKVWGIILMITLNPYFVTFSFTYYGLIYYMTETYPCGVKVMGFSNNSPAENAGITVGEVITRMGEKEINTVDEFLKYVDSVDTEEDIVIYTNDGDYIVSPKYSETRKKYLIGVQYASERCAHR